MTVPLLLDFSALPDPEPSSRTFPGTSHPSQSASAHAHVPKTWERLSLLRREIASLRAWLRDTPSTRPMPSRWVVETRLQQLSEEAERLASETGRPRNPARAHWAD